MRKTIQKTIANTEVDYPIRLFYVLGLGGVAISLPRLVLSLILGMWGTAALATLNVLTFGGLVYFAYKTGKHRQARLWTVVLVFMVNLPIMYFTSGGLHSGMPSVFMLAVIFTVLMLRRRVALLLCALEILEYSAACIFSFYYPQYVTFYASEEEVLLVVVLTCSLTSMICGAVLFFHLQEHERQRESLRQKNEQLTRYDASRSTFLTTVSHEIKNPLNAINLHALDTAELMEESPLNLELMQENQQVITKMVGRIDRILVDMKDTVAIEQGRLSLSLAPMRTQHMIQEVATQYFGKNYTADNELQLELDMEAPPIQADYARLTQVITNLLTNALQHTHGGQIQVSLWVDEGLQYICVADNGEGMSEQMREKALEGYVSASEDYWRHGIGLYVCHQIVEAHGGRIWIDSQLGIGTSVFFTLPYQEAL